MRLLPRLSLIVVVVVVVLVFCVLFCFFVDFVVGFVVAVVVNGCDVVVVGGGGGHLKLIQPQSRDSRSSGIKQDWQMVGRTDRRKGV